MLKVWLLKLDNLSNGQRTVRPKHLKRSFAINQRISTILHYLVQGGMNVGIIGIGGLGQMGIKLAKVSKYELISMN